MSSSNTMRTLMLAMIVKVVAARTTKTPDLFLNGEIQPAPVVVASLCMIGGFVITFFGYRLLRPTMFVAAFVAGSTVCYTVVVKNFESDWAPWLAFLIGGLAFGCLVLVNHTLSLFSLGACGGAALGMVLTTSGLYKIDTEHSEIVAFISIAAIALITGSLTVFFEKPLVIAGSSFLGAFMFVWGIGYFTKTFPTAIELQQYYNGETDVMSIPRDWWYYLAGIVGMFLLGILFQSCFSARNYDNIKRENRRRTQGYSGSRTPPHSNDPVRPVQLV